MREINGAARMLGVVLATAGAIGMAFVQPTAHAQSDATAEQPDAPSIAAVHWPTPPEAPANAPNVLIIMSDDVGFGSSSTFGGLIPTPTLDALAAGGARYSNFNTTAVCSPTRAALLTGRTPHNAGMGRVTNLPSAHDGYTTVIPKSTAMLPDILSANGYATAIFGKWHLTPAWEANPTGPFDRWPTGQGFDYFFGFMDGDTDQFSPALVENRVAIDPPTDDPDYILERDLTDRAIAWIGRHHDVTPNKPFFLYYSSGAAHAPNSAPQEWLLKFRGKFDAGWDKAREQIFARQKAEGVIPADAQLTPRPEFLPAWDAMTPQQQRVSARLMEAYAASLAYFDFEMGRLIESLKESGQYDNTLIFFIQGDNGATAEGGVQGLLVETNFLSQVVEDPAYMESQIDEIGGPMTYNVMPIGWSWAMDTPFQYYKAVASHFGGIRNGLVVTWPGKVGQSDATRRQFLHVSDIFPTVLDIAGIEAPAEFNGVAQKPVDGISFASTFADAQAAPPRTRQVFEMFEHQGIYEDGWWANTRPLAPWEGEAAAASGDKPARVWELYNLEQDFSQSRDLAAEHPERLARMKALFLSEAAQNNILPIHSHGAFGAAQDPATRALYDAPRLNRSKSFVYRERVERLNEAAAPPLVGTSYRITAEVEIPAKGARGVIVSEGSRFGGYSLYLHNGAPAFHYNAVGSRQYPIRSDAVLGPGKHRVEAVFASDRPVRGSGGTMVLRVDGKDVASGRIEHTLGLKLLQAVGFDIGRDSLTPVTEDYSSAESRFTGTIHEVRIDILD